MASAALIEVDQQVEAAPGLDALRKGGRGELFEKCRAFRAYLDGLRRDGSYQSQYRLVLEGPLDHAITVRDPFSGQAREMLCFDSNSYLGLHLHPRVVETVRRVLAQAGYGTPSAQLLGGTNRWLRELEEAVSAFYGREDTIVFPTGYAANLGALTALLRPGDVVACDRSSHASIHDGCRWSGARPLVYPHLDLAELDRLLEQEPPAGGGRLVVSDGVFSMHGHVAPLPGLRKIASRHGARLMVDEAHSLGVFGETGRGLEEHFALPGSIDVLMGTFSKAPGSLGGYVSGRADVVEYLRFFARSSMFTAALPAAICAGLSEALRVMQSEPEHRLRLWTNAWQLWSRLDGAGLMVPPRHSPILPVFVGDERLLFSVNRELFARGVKCGGLCYPAVPHGEAVLRLTVNARHTEEELERAARTIGEVARRFGIVRRTREEMREIAARVSPMRSRVSA